MLIEGDPHQILEGVLISGLTPCRSARRLHLPALGRVQALGPRAPAERAERGLRPRRRRAAIFSTRASRLDIVVHPGRRRVHLRRRDSAARVARGQARGFPAHQAAVLPGRHRALYGEPTPWSTTSRPWPTSHWIVNNGGAVLKPPWGAGSLHRTDAAVRSPWPGHVRKPGNYELEMVKTTFRDLIYAPVLGGGIDVGELATPSRAFIPGGGVSGSVVRARSRSTCHLGQDEVGNAGSMLGCRAPSSSWTRPPAWVARPPGASRQVLLLASPCGQCHALPSAKGSGWLELHPVPGTRMATGAREDLDLLMWTCATTSLPAWPGRPSRRTICVLGPSIPSSIASGIRMFRDEFLVHVKEEGCPFDRHERRPGQARPTQALAASGRQGRQTGRTPSRSTAGEVRAKKGELLIAAAERAGTYIPRFCYHPRMSPVGMCRMCLVEVDGPRGATLQPACFIEAADGMVVDTTSEKVKKAQDGVLEFLLANYLLDCPVSRQGGRVPAAGPDAGLRPGRRAVS